MATNNSEILSALQKAREKKVKPPYKGIKKVSDKRAKQIEEDKKLRNGEDTLLEQFFKRMRPRMVNVCQCGCGKPSSKKDDTYFRHSIAHIFPKSKFESVMYHPLNWVERAFFGGCHSQMDDTSIERWVNFADFDDIKEKFHALAPLLTDEERATKFYSQLEKLIYQ